MKRRIAALFQYDAHYARAVSFGIRKFLRVHPDWICETLPGFEPSGDWSWLAEGKWDGVIGYLVDPPLLEALVRLGIPSVNFSNSPPLEAPVPRVVSDDCEVGAMAARHFLERGLREFAYFGGGGSFGSRLRHRGFAGEVEARGFACAHLRPTYGQRLGRCPWVDVAGLPEKVAAAQGPIGVFCLNDFYARMVVHFCALHGFRIPDQVAVVGVDNSEVAEGLAEVPITSVELRCERIGFEAMELLAGLMDGAAPPAEPVLIPPARVVVRASSDLVAVGDPLVARALETIREIAFLPVGIEELLKRVPASRRLLERRLRAAVGRPPYEEILRLREERAKQLLTETPTPIAEISEACGFSDPKQLYRLFTARLGMSPGAFRRRFAAPR